MPDAPEFKAVSPVLIVSDVEAGVAFFKDTLGFDVHFTFGEPTEYGAVGRGPIQIHLSQDHAGGRAGKGASYVLVAGVDALYEEFKGKGVTMAVDLGDRPYRMRDFYIADPDGNTIGFGEWLASD